MNRKNLIYLAIAIVAIILLATIVFSSPVNRNNETAVNAARINLSIKTGVEAENISIKEVNEEEWSDTCLGIGKEEEICAEVITPGWEIILEESDMEYVYRADRDGNYVRLAD